MTSQKTKDLQQAEDPSASALTAMELPDGLLPMGHYRIDAMDIEAQGIARKPDGKVVFIEGALPFEEVSAQIHRSKNSFEKGVVTEIYRESS